MKKRGGDGSSGRPRPPMKTSHERVLESGAKKTSKARARRAARAKPENGALVVGAALRAPKKARPPGQPPQGVVDQSRPWSVASEAARERATAIAVAALDKKAVGVEILDVAGRVDYADFLVIMTGRSDRHTHALAQGIEEALKKKGVRPMAVEGLPHGSWVLMDFGDVVVHVFQDETRQIYDIEGLWLDARRLSVPKEAQAPE
jgi:ribosome-associated protein